MGAVKLPVVLMLAIAAVAGCSEGHEQAGARASSSTSASEASPLDCPNGRFEMAEADFYGEEPMKPYTGAPTPEDALAEYVQEPIARYSRVSASDPAYRYFQPSPDQAVFVRVDADGRRTMSVLLRPSSGGGWQGAAHIACEVRPAGR
jgi:hypothetical protein